MADNKYPPGYIPLTIHELSSNTGKGSRSRGNGGSDPHAALDGISEYSSGGSRQRHAGGSGGQNNRRSGGGGGGGKGRRQGGKNRRGNPQGGGGSHGAPRHAGEPEGLDEDFGDDGEE